MDTSEINISNRMTESHSTYVLVTTPVRILFVNCSISVFKCFPVLQRSTPDFQKPRVVLKSGEMLERFDIKISKVAEYNKFSIDDILNNEKPKITVREKLLYVKTTTNFIYFS